MSRRARLVALAVLLASGSAIAALLYRARPDAPLESTLTTTFQILGVPVKLADELASRVLPVGDLEEGKLGDIYRARFDAQARSDDRDQQYLDRVTPELLRFANRPFRYRIYVQDSSDPNAMALPGGIVLVTRSLLSTLSSEAELASVLGHELGHIELGHCFDAVRFELLSRKVGVEPLGTLADMAAQLLLRHAYSKTIEHEADDYAFQILLQSHYDPRGEPSAFASLRRYEATIGEATPARAAVFRDYFTSHPPLELRIDEYAQRAGVWWRRHPDERRYIGRSNLADRVAMGQTERPAEWVEARDVADGLATRS